LREKDKQHYQRKVAHSEN